eukprot:10931734-Heterocapsa_arctica.AAC.1
MKFRAREDLCEQQQGGHEMKGRKRQPGATAAAKETREKASERHAALVTRTKHGAASVRAAVSQKRPTRWYAAAFSE